MVAEKPELFDKVVEVEMDFKEENSDCWVYYWAPKSSDNRLEMRVKIPMRVNDRPYSTKKFAKELRIAILKICAKASATMGSGEKPDGSSMQENIDKGTIMLTMPAFRY